MHHIRQLKDLNPKLSKIDALMAANRRKQIPVCRTCHLDIHSSKSRTKKKLSNAIIGEPYDMKVSRTVRERGL